MITAYDLNPQECRLFESTDIEETRTRISAIMQPHDLEPLGNVTPRRAFMDYLDVSGLGIGSIGFGKMSVRLAEINDYHLVILCRRGDAIVRSRREELLLDDRTGICLPPGAPLDIEFSEDCEQFVVRISQGLFYKHTGYRNPNFESIDLTRPEWQSWARILWSMTDDLKFSVQDERVASDYQRLLLSLMLRATRQSIGLARSNSPSSVRRAEEFIRENSTTSLCLDDIARAAGISPRTLLSAFRHYKETTPLSFLRDLRLDRVNARLNKPTAKDTIAVIAREEGFGHLGRFSQEYTERFGEKPSETRRSLSS